MFCLLIVTSELKVLSLMFSLMAAEMLTRSYFDAGVYLRSYLVLKS